MSMTRGRRPLTESQERNTTQNRPGPHWWRVRHYDRPSMKYGAAVHVDRLDLTESVEDEVLEQEVTLAILECMGGTDGRGYIEELE